MLSLIFLCFYWCVWGNEYFNRVTRKEKERERCSEMEEYMNECEIIVGIAVMKIGHGCVRVRLVETSTTDVSKRKKIAS